MKLRTGQTSSRPDTPIAPKSPYSSRWRCGFFGVSASQDHPQLSAQHGAEEGGRACHAAEMPERRHQDHTLRRSHLFDMGLKLIYAMQRVSVSLADTMTCRCSLCENWARDTELAAQHNGPGPNGERGLLRPHASIGETATLLSYLASDAHTRLGSAKPMSAESPKLSSLSSQPVHCTVHTFQRPSMILATRRH